MSSPAIAGAAIPLFDLVAELDSIKDQLKAAFERVLQSGRFILGPEVERFEKKVALYLGCRHAIGVNSGTDALVIALRALEVGPGDEVVTTPFTFFATAEAISSVGARPIFVDIDPSSFNIQPEQVIAAFSDRTRAVIPVHLFGCPADLAPIVDACKRRGIALLEDAAQAFGSSYQGRKIGTWGDAGAFSFFPSKNLGALGDGGLIVTDSDDLAERCRKLRVHGSESKYYNEMIGYNSRLDELQAAFLSIRLELVDQANGLRMAAAAQYDELLRDMEWLSVPLRPRYGEHVYHQYTVRIHGRDRDNVQENLHRDGISTAVYYPVPLHRLPAYAQRAGPQLPHSDRATKEVLSIPMWPTISRDVQEQVASELASAPR